jgi:hypothetical protein
MKNSSLRTKPLVMKRRWSSMSMKKVSKKKRNNSNKAQHEEDFEEASISTLS